MPRPRIATKSTLTPEQRLNPEHMAESMYSERLAQDAANGRTAIYSRNPDARALYNKGVHDALTTLLTLQGVGLPAANVGYLMDQLHQQTADASPAMASTH